MKRVPFSKKVRVRYPMEGRVADDTPVEPIVKLGKQLKRTPFAKKHKVVHKVEDPNAEAKLSLIRKAVKLRGEIFKNLHCPMCRVNGDHNTNTVPHHILNKGFYDRLRFILWNLLPLCMFHHRWAHEHMAEFINWLLDNLPMHYRYYLSERDKRKPVRQTVESLTIIVEELQYYADHSFEAEQVIYEKE